MTPLKAIRLHCLDCSGGNRVEVRSCPIADCPLFAFRLGKNPSRARKAPKVKQPRPHVESRVEPGVPRYTGIKTANPGPDIQGPRLHRPVDGNLGKD
jgi:hypothetical protein